MNAKRVLNEPISRNELITSFETVLFLNQRERREKKILFENASVVWVIQIQCTTNHNILYTSKNRVHLCYNNK